MLASQTLAYRLASATTGQSRTGLFIVLSGRRKEHRRVALWKFPSDKILHAPLSGSGITIQVLQDTFSSDATYYKAAVFEGTRASTAFWKGKVEDKQAKSRVRELADFWAVGFLAARPAVTDVHGTRLLARALRETIKQTKSLETKEALIAAAGVIKSQVGRNISLNDFANNYLPEGTRLPLIQNAGGPEIADTLFQIDSQTLQNQLRFKSIVLDEVFTVRGPLDQFDDVVKVERANEDGIVVVSLRGKITSQALLVR